MTQETEDVVAQLRAKATWPEFSAADRDDFAEAADLIRSLSDRIDVLKGLISEQSIERLAKDIAIAFGDCFRSDVVSLRHGAMVRLGERLRNPLASDLARTALHQEGIDG